MRKLILLLILCSSVLCSQGQSSNKGTDFWVAYPLNYYFSVRNIQDMVLYLSATEAANVTVTGNMGTQLWQKDYKVAANSVVETDRVPKSGTFDSRLFNNSDAQSEGLYDKGIHIHSDVPIVAYAHCFSEYSSGAAMLLPVETWGYHYVSLNSVQSAEGYSLMLIMASQDNSRIEITPSVKTIGGRMPGIPFTIELNKGQVYQLITAESKAEFTGSRVSSVSNSAGKCYPIALYSGSSATAICGLTWDANIQQCFPSRAWGTRYLTAPFSTSGGADKLVDCLYRVLVKDPNTVVKKNGTILNGIINNNYYEYTSSTADYIESDKPVMVAQIMYSNASSCGFTGTVGDPEMIYISPIEQGVKQAGFYRNDKDKIVLNHLTLIIPTEGVRSLLIDGIRNDYDYSYDHPNMPGYSVIVKRYNSIPGQTIVKSDSAFTGIAYGAGYLESYGYNLGTLVKNLVSSVKFSNEHDSATLYETTCVDTRAQLVLKTEYRPTRLEWDLAGIPELASNGIIIDNNPVPYDSLQENGRKYYLYKLPIYFKFKKEGSFIIPVTITSPIIESCSSSETITSELTVKPYPKTDFTYTFNGCIPDSVRFTETTPAISGKVEAWIWVTENDTTHVQNAFHIYDNAGSYDVSLKVGLQGGCTADTVKTITFPDLSPHAAFDAPATICLPYGAAVFTDKSTYPAKPSEALVYDWTFGEGGMSSQKSPAYNYATAGNYSVRLIIRALNGCTDTATHQVASFFNRPVARFSITDTALCVLETAQLSESSLAAPGSSLTEWFWDLGDNRATKGNTPSITYNKTGKYTIRLHVKDDQGCLSDTLPVAVEIFGIPSVYAGAEKIMVEGFPVVLDGKVTGELSLQWSPGTLVSDSNVQTPFALATADQLYYLHATGDNGCSAYDSVMIRVVDLIKVPNAFSPNGDGINDVWSIPGLAGYTGASIQIFNRWGQKVYESRGYQTPWNGRINGSRIPMGTYYYRIDPHHPNASIMNGSVTVIY